MKIRKLTFKLFFFKLKYWYILYKYSWRILSNVEFYRYPHRVIILLKRAYLHKRIGRNWWNFSRPECATSLETAHSLANCPNYGRAEGEVCILRSPGVAASPISLLSMGGVCGRGLTAGKILFIGRQTCSLYYKYNDSVVPPQGKQDRPVSTGITTTLSLSLSLRNF